MSEQGETLKLIEKILSGDSKSLESLLKLKQDFIYNICKSMFLNPMDAEDITQEILTKIVTSLNRYERTKASFNTWLYRITINHTITIKKQTLENFTFDFEAMGRDLDLIPLEDFQKEELARPETKLLIDEARIGCSMGMFLCLDRNQRATFILGEIMKIPHKEAALIIGISVENFRQRLSRARKDLFNFMENKCGLINKTNPCRCEKKAIGFMKAGWVDKNNLKFASDHFKKMKEVAKRKDCIEDEYYQKGYDEIYDENPYYPAPKEILDKIFSSIVPEFMKSV